MSADQIESGSKKDLDLGSPLWPQFGSLLYSMKGSSLQVHSIRRGPSTDNEALTLIRKIIVFLLEQSSTLLADLPNMSFHEVYHCVLPRTAVPFTC